MLKIKTEILPPEDKSYTCTPLCMTFTMKSVEISKLVDRLHSWSNEVFEIVGVYFSRFCDEYF